MVMGSGFRRSDDGLDFQITSPKLFDDTAPQSGVTKLFTNSSELDCSQKINPIFEIRLGCQANLLQQSLERLPDGHLLGNNDPPMFLVLSDILIVQSHKVPDIECHEAAFFLDGKRKLFAVGASSRSELISS